MGIILAMGDHIKEGYKINAKIYDIAPTILHIFSLPIPDDIDGSPTLNIFKDTSDYVQRKVKHVNYKHYEKTYTSILRVSESLRSILKNS